MCVDDDLVDAKAPSRLITGGTTPMTSNAQQLTDEQLSALPIIADLIGDDHREMLIAELVCGV